MRLSPTKTLARCSPGPPRIQSESRLFRVFEAIPFLLALGLPGPLCSLMWRGQHRARTVAAWFGRIGFALYALALFIGMFTSAAAASSYVDAQSANARAAIALDYAFRYAGETLIWPLSMNGPKNNAKESRQLFPPIEVVLGYMHNMPMHSRAGGRTYLM